MGNNEINMSKFTEAKLEQAFIELLENEGYQHFLGNTISRADDEVLIEEDLKTICLIAINGTTY